MNSPLIFRSVTKRFGKHRALDSIDLDISTGHIVGLLGRNGAGKSTLFNLACGLVLPSEGSCLTLGMASGSLAEAQLAKLGVVHQSTSFPIGMTVRKVIEFTASFYPHWDQDREQHLLRELELPQKQLANQLSPGDQQKISLICAVCHHPSLLLLDEPVSALDPIARTRMLHFLVSLAREDAATVIISSHLLTDVEKIVDWVVCLNQGAVTENASLDDILEKHAAAAGRPLNLEQLFPELITARKALL